MDRRAWVARGLIGLVTFFNLQCAVLFLWSPDLYAPGFEVSGVPGSALVRGMGILFIMWNIPYLAALWRPAQNRVSLIEAIVMQAVGVVGETLLVLGLPAGHPALVDTTRRFILFDGGGLILLVCALGMIKLPPKRR